MNHFWIAVGMLALLALGNPLAAGEENAPLKIRWATLEKVTMVEKDGELVPEFSQELLDLQGKTVQVEGYMLPLDAGITQLEFLLTSSATESCEFCAPGGPVSYAGVNTVQGEPIRVSLDRILVQGRLELIYYDPLGLCYRLVEAVQIKKE